jgi:hypothetical protein
MNFNMDYLLGFVALVFIFYFLKPEWFGSPSDFRYDTGYTLSRVFRHLMVVYPPVVELPDGSRGMFVGFRKETVGERWVLESDSFHVHGLRSILNDNVNLNYGSIVAMVCGSGTLYCNIDLAGVEHPNWQGIGNPRENSLFEENKRLKSELRDALVRLEDAIKQRDRAILRDSELAETIGKRRVPRDPMLTPPGMDEMGDPRV